MATPFFYVHLLTLFVMIVASQSQNSTNSTSTIGLSTSLTPITKPPYWLSPSGLYAFGFYRRGNNVYSVGIFLAGIPQQTVVWTAARDNNPPLPTNSTLSFGADGNLVLQSPLMDQYTIAGGGSSASMLDTGNFVIYDSSGKVMWQSFDNPTDTLLVGQRLGTGNELFSWASEDDPSRGRFQLIMQQDGYVAMYPINAPFEARYGYWDSGVGSDSEGSSLTLTNDGLLYTVNATAAVRNLSEGGLPRRNFIYRATLDVDGIFRLYSYSTAEKGEWEIKWLAPDDKCAPLGLCGLNAYCTTVDLTTDCLCLEGFTYVNPSDRTSGCQRDSIAVGCHGMYKNVRYAMRDVSYAKWLNNSYSVNQTLTEDSCRAECLNDCNCEVAMYENGYCAKQLLPLRYGMRISGSSSTLLVKKAESGWNVVADGPRSKKIKKEVIVVGISLIALASAMLVLSAVLIYRHRVWVRQVIPNDGNPRVMDDVAPKSFTFEELSKVTRDFSEEIGRGAFGTVYRGTMIDSLVVAVKRLERVSPDAEKEFQTEIRIIGRTHHRNLVRLVGYCLDGSKRLLVYEYMSNGSLADILFTPNRQPNWDEKMGIARNVARGLLYLHEECETQIIHCDIKPQNILIDKNGCAKIADFGLSKLLKPDQTKTLTNIRGTRGYVASEWHKRLPITVKADVYSFGVVLLEIICCRRCLDHDLSEEEAVLEDWVYDCFQADELYKLVDGEEVDKKQLERMVKVAIWCILEEPSLRPSMRKVLLMLEGTIDIPVRPHPTSFISAI